MKRTIHWLLTGIAVVFGCSIANAQFSFTNALAGATLIYSNAFNGSSTLNISNTAPNYAVTLFGGSNNAVWIDAGGSGDTNAFYANGSVGTGQGDTILLPFKAQSNQVYILKATVNMTGNPGSWVTCGYAQNYSTPGIANSAPNGGGVNSYAWTLRNYTGNTEYFAGAAGANTIYNSTPAGPVNAGTYTYIQVLNTTSNKWSATAFFNGVELGSPYAYASAPSIGAIGLGQHALTSFNNYQWTSLTLSANRLAILQEPAAAANVNDGGVFTNLVVMGGAPPFSYQWYTNGVAIGAATNASVVLNPVTAGDAGTNFYVVVTNVYGSVTSSPTALTVNTTPTFVTADPVTYTNVMTLLGGTNDNGTIYLGSSPSFSVATVGEQPVTYQWLTNGVAVDGATNTTFTFTNCQLDSPTNFSCIAYNSLGTGTNTWGAQYIPTSTAPFPQMILADGPVGYWRLDETNDDTGQLNDGEICNDFMSGNNGVYTNTALGFLPGYSATTDPNEMTAFFGPPGPATGGAAFSVGTNVDFSAYSNAEFTVSIWANGGWGGYYSGTEPQNGGLIAKGGDGQEEFAIDDGAGNSDLRFMVRNAAGTLSSASSTNQLGGDDTWHHIVGVCDESNGVISLYVDGLSVAQTSIAKNSGVLHDGTIPIQIGSDGSGQFYGALNDAAVFNYALNGGQIAQLYQAPGNTIPPSIVAPVPPTNAVYQANTTLTVPAFAIGTPPMGYYWTNVTAGGVISSGSTDVLQTLNATLTIPNAPASLSGDQLELVVTNATASTTWYTTLFSPPPPITLGYSNAILYSNNFDGGTWSIDGQPMTAENSLIGGTNMVWTDVLGTNDTGSMQANGVDNCTLPNSWIVPFTPHSGYIYTETASLTFYGNPGNWVAMGFAQNFVSNTTSAGFNANGPNGIDWILLQVQNDNVQYFAGPGGNGQITSKNSFFASGSTPHTVQVVLDTTQPQWVQYAFVDGVSAGTNTYASNPTISAAGITQYGPLSAPNDVRWNNWSLSQVAPGGVPPYVMNSLPSSVTLTNSTVTIPATVYGSAPLGYYWSFNNSTVLESGTTNSLSPLSADLNVPSSSLSSGQLELTVTNAYGTNITLVTVISPVNTNPTNIVTAVTNNNLYLSWPTDHIGWQLQAETNSNAIGLSNNWVNVTGSTGTNQIVVPMDLNNGSVFYRLTY